MSFVTRWNQSISRAGRDGIALSRAVYGVILPGKRSQPTSLASTTNKSLGERIKSVLLQQARREPVPNSLAISMLKIDKEIGLVRYWGLAEYLKQNQPIFSFASLSSRGLNQKADSANKDKANSASTGGETSVSTSSGSTARIAFMITSSMKRDLVDGMGYQASVVKSMTPQQASLVLHHRLAPEFYEQEISKLEEAFEEEQQQQQQQQQLRTSLEDSEESEPKSNAEASPSTIENSIGKSDGDSDFSVQSSGSVEDSSGESPLLLSSSSSHASQETPSTSVPLSPLLDQTEGGIDIWYEVVEIKEEGTKTNEIRHGLYKDHDEAVLGLETRQDIHNRREQEAQATEKNRNEGESDNSQQVSFILRSVSGKDLE